MVQDVDADDLQKAQEVDAKCHQTQVKTRKVEEEKQESTLYDSLFLPAARRASYLSCM
jgi:hypothetical protein